MCSLSGGGTGSTTGGRVGAKAAGAGVDTEGAQLLREGAGEERAGPAEEGPARGPWGVSSAAAEVHFFFPDALVGITGLVQLMGPEAMERKWVGNDILLSPLPVSKRSISSASSSLGESSSQGLESD
jgi:hypothetical protein